MGRLATMLGGIELSKTPLERRVDALGRRIARWVLLLAVLLGVLGIIAEGVSRAPRMVIFAVALAVAAVPEGLPAVVLGILVTLFTEAIHLRNEHHRGVVPAGVLAQARDEFEERLLAFCP